MNVYDAMMKAADQIEARPDLFRFMSSDVPANCGSPGCALGWIGHFARRRDLTRHDQVSKGLLGLHPLEFYKRLSELDGESPEFRIIGDWADDPALCASTLRAYAAKYHGDEKPKLVTPPNWQAIASKWTVGDDVRSQELVS